MANNREVSQLGSIIKVGDSAGRVGIANSVGINTTAPTGSFALDVHGTTNLQGNNRDEDSVLLLGLNAGWLY